MYMGPRPTTSSANPFAKDPSDFQLTQAPDFRLPFESIINLEGINIKNPVTLPEKVDFCVVDLSFISLKLALKNIFSLLIEKGEVVALVKPQFEVGKSGVGKGGIVKNKQTRIDALVQLFDWCTENGFFVKNAIRSPIEGKNGNVEFFFHLTTSNECLFQREELEKL